MTVRITRTGSRCMLTPEEPKGTVDLARASAVLGRVFRYRMKGCEHAPAFIEGKWDGFIRLVKQRKGGISFPSGLFREAVSLIAANDIDFEVTDTRPDPEPIPTLERWGNPRTTRGYQWEAVKAALAQESGILKMAIRSGKTHTAGRIIHELRLKTLFIVPSQLLLAQSAEAMEENFPDASVTRVGESERDFSGDIVVATVQSLIGKEEELSWHEWGILFVDEAHHAGDANKWSETLLKIDARYKLALSATIDIPKRGGMETSTIWVRALCGPIIFEVTMDELIDWGHLTRPTVRFVHYRAPMADGPWSTERYGELVVDCKARNRAICDVAEEHAKAGEPTLVDVWQVRHARVLFEMMRSRLKPGQVAVMTGKTKKDERKKILDGFRGGAIKLVIGNLLGEGVDIPELQVLVNAEGGKADTATIQRMRNLTKHEGKESATIYEMVDLHHATLCEWTEARYASYAANKTFVIDEGEWE